MAMPHADNNDIAVFNPIKNQMGFEGMHPNRWIDFETLSRCSRIGRQEGKSLLNSHIVPFSLAKAEHGCAISEHADKVQFGGLRQAIGHASGRVRLGLNLCLGDLKNLRHGMFADPAGQAVGNDGLHGSYLP